MQIQKFKGLFITLTKILSESEAILHLSYHLIITDYIKNEPCRNNDFFCNMCVFYARSLPENKRIRNRFSFIFCWWRITSIWGNQRFLLFVMLGQQKVWACCSSMVLDFNSNLCYTDAYRYYIQLALLIKLSIEV